MIVCHAIAKGYAGRAVLAGVDLAIAAGEICALLGANGAGKSTLLRVVAGLERAAAGRVAIDGVDVASGSTSLKRRLGVVSEELGLFESLTVSENLLAMGPMYGLSTGEVRTRTADMLQLLDLEAGQATPARDCSFGMRKKLALAMALLHRPEILLLDEPFEGIDPGSTKRIERTLQAVAERKATILFTSHNLPVVEQLATRVLVLGGGRMMWDSASAAGEKGRLTERYFGLVGRPAQEVPDWLGS